MQSTSRGVARAALVAADVDAASSLLSLRWADGLRRTFHPLWLRDQCASRRHPGTRQRLISAADLPRGLRVAEAEAGDDVLRVQWEPAHSSSFCATWLREHGTATDKVQPVRLDAFAPSQDAAAAATAGARSTPPTVRRMHFDELRDGGAAARWRWLRALADDGATLLEGVPSVVHDADGGSRGGGGGNKDGIDGVQYVAELIGPMQPNIYGNIFDVVSKGSDAENLAYTSEAIGPHMDLCYYESPPGLQLLHCLQFDPDVVGGGSLLIDAFAVAEALREALPATFATLSTLPATFLKDHSRRARPVLLSYQRPHLAVDPRDQRLTGVFWSPPFEGPVRGFTPSEVDAYYAAYAALHAAIDAAPKWEGRMQPGEMLVFNNRRMLHGRQAFEATAGGGRHLRGGYVNIDEFANARNLLRREYADGDEEGAAPLGNQDWATVPIELPSEQSSRAREHDVSE